MSDLTAVVEFRVMKLVIPILLLVILGCSQTNTAPKTPDGPPIAVKAADLTKAYDANELAADGQYKGKLLEVSGTISNISETFGSIQVDLEGHEKNGIVSVKCVFNEDQKQSVAVLRKGAQTTLIGKGDGMTAGLYVGLNECKIK